MAEGPEGEAAPAACDPVAASTPLDGVGGGATPDPAADASRRWPIHLLWLSIFLGVTTIFHELLPGFYDGDTGYHLAVAQLTRKYGVLQSFPWTPFSWLAEHYADKEFLFHVFLVPFAGLDADLASRLAGTLLGAMLLGTLYAILRSERVPHAGWWALLPLAISSAFVHRLILVRAHLLSIPLAMTIAWSAARGRWWVLAIASFLFPLCYTAWHLPVVLIGIVEAVRLVSQRRFEWRGPVVAGTALLAGIAVHPNFPANLELFWIQNYTVLFDTVWAGKQGFAMGGEFNAFSPVSMLRYVLPAGVAVAVATALAWPRRREELAPLALAAIAVAFLLITLRTQRFIEYLAPFAALALALCWRAPRWRHLAPALVAAGSLWIALFATRPIELLRERERSFPPEVATVLQEMVPPGEQVVTCEWHVTGEMMLALPERRFMVALDPVFMAMQDEALYRLWFETMNEPPVNAGAVLREGFDARFVICDRRVRWLPLVRALEADEAAVLRGIVGLWVVYELLPASAGEAAPLALQ